MADIKSKVTPDPTPPVDSFAEKMALLEVALKTANETNDRLAEKEKQLDETMKTAKPMFEANAKDKALVAQQHKTDALKMKEHLSTQDKVKIFVPLEGKEPKGSQLPVTLNGYRVNVPKGMYVAVPEQVADIIMESLNQTAESTNIPQNLDNMDEARKTHLM